MGQRSQIYVSYNNGVRRVDGSLAEPKEEMMFARYFQWNYGERMISRAAALIQRIECDKREFGYVAEWKLPIIASVNFDAGDCVQTEDLVDHAKDYCNSFAEMKEYIFYPHNNDGKLFIHFDDDGTIKYCFTDGETSKPMTASEYANWDSPTDQSDKTLAENIKRIEEHAVLMTDEELEAFIDRRYFNVYLPESHYKPEEQKEYVVKITMTSERDILVKAGSLYEARQHVAKAFDYNHIPFDSVRHRYHSKYLVKEINCPHFKNVDED